MWPHDFPTWIEAFHDSYERHETQRRLASYPVLNAFAQRYAEHGLERAQLMAASLQGEADYFVNQPDFFRWMRIVTYREALRWVLKPEPVDRCLRRLKPEHQRILQRRYIDQFNDEELARSFNWNKPIRFGTLDTGFARQHALEAYQALCDALTGSGSSTGSRRLEHASVFPLFPGLCRP